MSSTVSCILSNLLKVAKINYLWLLFRLPNAVCRRHDETICLKQSSTVWSEWVWVPNPIYFEIQSPGATILLLHVGSFTASVSLFREWLESEEVNIQGLIMLFIIQCRPNPCPTAPSLTFTKHTYKAVPSMPMTPHGKYWIIFTWELLPRNRACWVDEFLSSLIARYCLSAYTYMITWEDVLRISFQIYEYSWQTGWELQQHQMKTVTDCKWQGSFNLWLRLKVREMK